MTVNVIEGDLLDQDVEVLVNAWNRNFIPYFLLFPQGVSGALRRRAGTAPFRELMRYGLLSSGDAVMTSAGKLPHKGILHVAALTWYWTSSPEIVRKCAVNALRVLRENKIRSAAFPLIGAGTGGVKPEDSQRVLTEELGRADDVEIRIVRYKRT